MVIESITYTFARSDKDLNAVAEVKFERNYCFKDWAAYVQIGPRTPYPAMYRIRKGNPSMKMAKRYLKLTKDNQKKR